MAEKIDKCSVNKDVFTKQNHGESTTYIHILLPGVEITKPVFWANLNYCRQSIPYMGVGGLGGLDPP